MPSEFEALRSDEDVDAILRLALRKTGSDGGDLRRRLHMSASELGISEADLAAAEREYAQQQSLQQDWSAFDLERRHAFKSHLWTYIAVNAFLLGINLLTRPTHMWFIYPLMGWGLGMVFQGIHAFSRNAEVEREFQRWRRKRQKQRGEIPAELIEVEEH